MEAVKVTRKAEQSQATQGALLAAARELFAERGYAAVATEEIVRGARVTRGALYHHFAGKEDVLRALCHELSRELAERCAAAALAHEDQWRQILAGLDAFLDGCTDPAVQQILMLDAPVVLGWEEWRTIDAQYGLGMVRASLDAAMESGLIEPQPPGPLTHLIVGALDEAAMYIARADDPVAARREIGDALRRLLEGLRA
jgi:AcrR family transcriptional regulator